MAGSARSSPATAKAFGMNVLVWGARARVGERRAPDGYATRGQQGCVSSSNATCSSLHMRLLDATRGIVKA